MTMLFSILSTLLFAPLPEPRPAAPATAMILSAHVWQAHWGTTEYVFTFDQNGTYRADLVGDEDGSCTWAGKWSVTGNTLTVREWMASNDDVELTWIVNLAGTPQTGFLGVMTIPEQENRQVPLSLVRVMVRVP